MDIIHDKSSDLSPEASELLRKLRGYDSDALQISSAAIADELLEFERMANLDTAD